MKNLAKKTTLSVAALSMIMSNVPAVKANEVETVENINNTDATLESENKTTRGIADALSGLESLLGGNQELTDENEIANQIGGLLGGLLGGESSDSNDLVSNILNGLGNGSLNIKDILNLKSKIEGIITDTADKAANSKLDVENKINDLSNKTEEAISGVKSDIYGQYKIVTDSIDQIISATNVEINNTIDEFDANIDAISANVESKVNIAVDAANEAVKDMNASLEGIDASSLDYTNIIAEANAISEMVVDTDASLKLFIEEATRVIESVVSEIDTFEYSVEFVGDKTAAQVELEEAEDEINSILDEVQGLVNLEYSEETATTLANLKNEAAVTLNKAQNAVEQAKKDAQTSEREYEALELSYENAKVLVGAVQGKVEEIIANGLGNVEVEALSSKLEEVTTKLATSEKTLLEAEAKLGVAKSAIAVANEAADTSSDVLTSTSARLDLAHDEINAAISTIISKTADAVVKAQDIYTKADSQSVTAREEAESAYAEWSEFGNTTIDQVEDLALKGVDYLEKKGLEIAAKEAYELAQETATNLETEFNALLTEFEELKPTYEAAKTAKEDAESKFSTAESALSESKNAIVHLVGEDMTDDGVGGLLASLEEERKALEVELSTVLVNQYTAEALALQNQGSTFTAIKSALEGFDKEDYKGLDYLEKTNEVINLPSGEAWEIAVEAGNILAKLWGDQRIVISTVEQVNTKVDPNCVDKLLKKCKYEYTDTNITRDFTFGFNDSLSLIAYLTHSKIEGKYYKVVETGTLYNPVYKYEYTDEIYNTFAQYGNVEVKYHMQDGEPVSDTYNFNPFEIVDGKYVFNDNIAELVTDVDALIALTDSEKGVYSQWINRRTAAVVEAEINKYRNGVEGEEDNYSLAYWQGVYNTVSSEVNYEELLNDYNDKAEEFAPIEERYNELSGQVGKKFLGAYTGSKALELYAAQGIALGLKETYESASKATIEAEEVFMSALDETKVSLETLVQLSKDLGLEASEAAYYEALSSLAHIEETILTDASLDLVQIQNNYNGQYDHIKLVIDGTVSDIEALSLMTDKALENVNGLEPTFQEKVEIVKNANKNLLDAATNYQQAVTSYLFIMNNGYSISEELVSGLAMREAELAALGLKLEFVGSVVDNMSVEKLGEACEEISNMVEEYEELKPEEEPKDPATGGDLPGKPEEPGTATGGDLPGKPEEPETPVVPDTPVVPEEPETPVVPDTPVVPEEPETPVVPDTPVVPEEPETPVVPDTPVVPEEPETPVVPDTPVEPEEPETPVEPEIPVVTPSRPSRPSRPSTPAVEEEEEEILDIEDEEVAQGEAITNPVIATVVDQPLRTFLNALVQKEEIKQYSTFGLKTFDNSRVTGIKATSKGFTITGYMWIDGVTPTKDTWREIVLVNTEDMSTEFAYRKQTKAVDSSWLNDNKIATQDGKLDLTYAGYSLDVNYDDLNSYTDNKSGAKIKAGTYQMFMRISDGKDSFLFPLVDRVLSDGSTMESTGTLPTGFAVMADEVRSLTVTIK